MSLEFTDVSVGFHRYSGWLRRAFVPVLDNISFHVAPGEVVGLIGASGSGKSLLANAVLQNLPGNAECRGEIRLHGRLLNACPAEPSRDRPSVALAPQSLDALDPLLPVGRQIERFARLSGLTAGEARQAVQAVIAQYGLAPQHLKCFPHELSGGMARRALLATATAGESDFLLADEPTVGLDALAASDILGHLRGLADAGRGVLVISHDLSALTEVADRIVTLRGGRMEEETPAAAFRRGVGLAPYGQALWAAQPVNGMQATAGIAA